jgi:hypothetical protein
MTPIVSWKPCADEITTVREAGGYGCHVGELCEVVPVFALFGEGEASLRRSQMIPATTRTTTKPITTRTVAPEYGLSSSSPFQASRWEGAMEGCSRPPPLLAPLRTYTGT